MKKRAISILLTAAAIISLSGCTALFKKEYLSVSQYTEGEYDSYDGYMCEVSNYAELNAAIFQMVEKHSAEERIRFTDYDGNMQSDPAQAGWEVKAETALASYCVEYMSYDLNRIVTYYEAVIHISYKRNEREIENIISVEDREELEEGIGLVLAELSDYAAFHIPNAVMTEEDVAQTVYNAYAADPVSCAVLPTVQIQLHPKSGVFRIVELELDYGRSVEELDRLKLELSQRMAELTDALQKTNKEMFALDAYNLLASNCSYDPDGSLRRERLLDETLSSTAYAALVDGCADSQGIALAYSALCRVAGIECLVVRGSVDKQEHFWNIININGSYYHVDVSADSTWGVGNSFLMSDEQMQARCWWNIEDYPECGKTSGKQQTNQPQQ